MTLCSGGNLVLTLACLCELEPPEITGQGIEQSPGSSSYTALRDHGALVHVGNSESVLCSACDYPHSMSVEYAGDGKFRAYCPDSGYQPVAAEELHRFAIAQEWIVRTVRSSLGLKLNPPPTLNETVMRVGRARFGPYTCELFFGRRLSEPHRFRQTKHIIQGLVAKTPAVLLTTTPHDHIPGEPPPRCGIVGLADVLRITSADVSFDEEPIYAALRGNGYHSIPGGIGFKFSPGYRSGLIGDQEYSFTDKQALVIEALDEARREGTGRLHQSEIMGKADTSQRVGQIFAHHPAYGMLIKYDGSGYYWLDL